MKQKWKAFLFLLMFTSFSAFAQNITVKGIVKGGEDNQPLPGVVIKVEGTGTGTVTDLTGAFKIDVPSAETKLIFSYVGMEPQTLPAGSGADLNVTLKVKELKEVVVTALGISKETKTLGYSVSTVSGDDVRASGETNVIEGLAAKAPGIQVTGSGGAPGSSSKIVIRGNNTLTGDNQPLIIVDGIPIDNTTNNITGADNPYNQNLQGVSESNRALDLNPDDIATVTILKGAAAAALYGSKAANGAIIYTTKRGKPGKGIGGTYSSSVTLDRVNKLPGLQTNWAQGNNGVYDVMTPGPSGIPNGPDQISNGTGSSWGPNAKAAGLPTYDNVGKYFQTGVTTNNNIALTGGNENSSVRLSIGNTHQTGVQPNSKMDRTSVRLTADTKINSKFSMGGTVNYSNTSTLKPQNGSNYSGSMFSLLRTPITFDASNYLYPASGLQRQYFAYYDNPFFSAYQNPFNDETNRIMGNVFFNVKATDHLDLNWRVGTDAYHTANRQVYAISSQGNDNADGTGQVNIATVDNRNLYSDLTAKYNKQINENFGTTVLLGYNFQYNQYQSLFMRGRGLAIPNFYNLNSAASLYTSNLESYENSNAVFLDASFDYKRAVYLSLTGRNEWNSAFGKGASGFFYPKTDIAWDFSESVKLPKWFSFGKVRASYASVGKAPSPYSTRTAYAAPFIADGWTTGLGFPYGGSFPGYGISNTLNNPTLKPERTNEVEAGTDVRFFDGRLTLDVTAYQRTSSDVLIYQPVAPTSGYSYRFTNAGEIQNHGLEIAVGADPVRKKDFSWNIMINWAKNVSRVTKLADGVTSYLIEQGFGDPGAYAIIGQPYGVFYGTAWERDNKGNIVVDANGLPVKAATSQILGNPNPDWLAGITNTLKYKAWTFAFLWDFRKGGQIWNGTYSSLNLRGRSADSDNRNWGPSNYIVPGVYAPGTPDAGKTNTTPLDPFTYFSYYKGANGASENSIQDGGWIRLRSISLTRHFNFVKGDNKVYIQYLDLGVSCRNLLLFTKYSGVDPETSLTGAGSNINGFDFYNNPGTKSYMFTLKAGF